MTFPVTSLYILPLLAILIVLFVRVILRRVALGSSLGHADDANLHERIRQHGNFIESVPFALILLALAEANAANSVALHTAGGLLVVARLAHPFGISATNPKLPLRAVGATLTALVMVALAVMIAMARF